MPALLAQTDAFVLLKRPATDNFQQLTLFSAVDGRQAALQRLLRKAAGSGLLDLFDEAHFFLESSNQGQTWFVREHRLLHRPEGIARRYESLQYASALASLVAGQPSPEENRREVYALLRQAFASFATGVRPDAVYFKSLYLYARDEGHPVKEQWWPQLPEGDRAAVAAIVNQPLAGQTTEVAVVERLIDRLELYLRSHTELMVE